MMKPQKGDHWWDTASRVEKRFLTFMDRIVRPLPTVAVVIAVVWTVVLVVQLALYLGGVS